MTADAGSNARLPLLPFMQFVQPLPNGTNRPKASGILKQIHFSAANNHLQPKFITEGTMANQNLQGKKVAILATNGFEQSELLEPRKALDQAGATTKVVSPEEGKIKGWNHKDWGQEVPVDLSLASANARRLRRPASAGRCHEPGSSANESAGSRTS